LVWEASAHPAHKPPLSELRDVKVIRHPLLPPVTGARASRVLLGSELRRRYVEQVTRVARLTEDVRGCALHDRRCT
jgi:hypothetical protein